MQWHQSSFNSRQEEKAMRIAVTSEGETLESQVDPRFGRASVFLVVDTENMAFKAVKNNQNLNLPQGAGIQAAQNVIQHNPEAVLTGNCGPKAFKVLQAGGVEVVVGVQGTVSDAIRAYIDGKYEPTKEANVEGHWA
jgi:predicted Fe-Mo cluster-binding NifX family protein